MQIANIESASFRNVPRKQSRILGLTCFIALLAAPAAYNVTYATVPDAITAQSDLPTPPRLASMGIDVATELSVLPELLEKAYAREEASGSDDVSATASQAVMPQYQAALPHTTQPTISQQEKLLLQLYLDNPTDVDLCRYFAVYHLYESLLGNVTPGYEGVALGHTIIAAYFLERLDQLGAPVQWYPQALQLTQSALDSQFNPAGLAITEDENHPAHLYFRETFHLNNEENRYSALDDLLQDFYSNPKNVYTSFAITAINLWIGGEADYADPTTLYNFSIGSYFSLHTIDLAHQLETAWVQNPASATRFRMAATLGGFSLLQRRWLAGVAHDAKARALIDNEHREWYAIQPAFHAFTLALPFFYEKKNFAQGLDRYEGGFAFCNTVPVRTCLDQPRFPFNLLGFALGYVDYLLKSGDVTTAREYLAFNQDPSQTTNFEQWTLGRGPWQYRIDHLDDLVKLYQSSRFQEGPVNFETKRRKWGGNTTICQICHETQGKPQTLADIEQPQILPPPQVATIGNWPEVTTTWFGAVPTELQPLGVVASGGLLQ